MSENKASGTGAEAPTVPGVDVKIYLPKDPDKDHGKLLSFASVNLGGALKEAVKVAAECPAPAPQRAADKGDR